MNLSELRREYGSLTLDEEDARKHNGNPISLFEAWLAFAISKGVEDATAFVLATIDAQQRPDTRIVLLKEIKNNGFVFFTHYTSKKAEQIHQKNNVAMNFYWPALARQVRVRGSIQKTSRLDAEHYFSSRPLESQISTCISNQSSIIENRNMLEMRFQEYMQEMNSRHNTLSCPLEWGGYIIKPVEIEFFQGRDRRLHDRLLFSLEHNAWNVCRLAP
ncbi:pyridoxamine 5'-phosphate oxidase [Candidatus Berkiella cookevillensis]|uniref:Pyridoxamine 5'-phosphate oxidase n=1 Tax=Candidatus Berkiella cookevillensis TaxID=437022 RepID=A0A0Q9YV81_9GAMM|nr:pyridoxamine 5'-phosphate oxidase [Candidatus Berkiella cookevillensis]MCS5708403.1 pyridoxamine 5'-phosphate oxidase [Candidatus Berkiella cookevillensis]